MKPMMIRIGLAGLAMAALAAAPMVQSTDGATRAAMPSDFDGDGYADLAIGVVGEDRERGAVNVLYGSTTGLTAAGDQRWSQDSSGVKGTSQREDAFGYALASGDFDRDGFADLAVGVPWDDSRPDPSGRFTVRGAVNVLYGSANGLTAAGDQRWSRATLLGLSWDEIGGWSSSSLAAGDFDGDGFWDLGIGGVDYDLSGARGPAGATVLRGSPGGLTTHGAVRLTTVLSGGNTHVTLAAGDLDDDGLADLAVGLPGADLDAIADAGEVGIYEGNRDGLLIDSGQRWTQDSPGIEDEAELYDEYGGSLAIGDFDADGFGDLAIGVMEHDWTGAVAVLRGAAGGLTADGNQLWNQDVPGIPSTSETGDRFGASLAAGDFDRDGADDLAIGVPGETPGQIFDENPWGAVTMIYGGGHGLAATGSQLWTQDSPGVPGTNEKRDSFGSSLASANYGRSAKDDLAIGVPSERFGESDSAGMVNVLYGRVSGLSGLYAQGWSQKTAGVRGTAEPDDHFGGSLSP